MRLAPANVLLRAVKGFTIESSERLSQLSAGLRINGERLVMKEQVQGLFGWRWAWRGETGYEFPEERPILSQPSAGPAPALRAAVICSLHLEDLGGTRTTEPWPCFTTGGGARRQGRRALGAGRQAGGCLLVGKGAI